MYLKPESDCAIRMVMCLAEHGGQADIGVIAKSVRLNEQEIQQSAECLERACIIRCMGSRCVLTRRPKELTVHEVLTAAGQDMRFNCCTGTKKQCPRDAVESCPVHRYYTYLQETLENDLENKTFAALLADKRGRIG